MPMRSSCVHAARTCMSAFWTWPLHLTHSAISRPACGSGGSAGCGMTLDDIVRRFDAKRSGAGYMAQCPVHEDDKASLSIGQDKDKILLYCQAGCKTETILRAKNLTM